MLAGRTVPPLGSSVHLRARKSCGRKPAAQRMLSGRIYGNGPARSFLGTVDRMSHAQEFLSWTKPWIDRNRDEHGMAPAHRELEAWWGRQVVQQWASLHSPTGAAVAVCKKSHRPLPCLCTSTVTQNIPGRQHTIASGDICC